MVTHTPLVARNLPIVTVAARQQSTNKYNITVMNVQSKLQSCKFFVGANKEKLGRARDVEFDTLYVMQCYPCI